ncbi:MAG TPA: GNAT family N-acetyltransferase [Chloroflexia bacterium]|nr:GNAT family N-acetyltransferase [Chloroflexia bacterium]
MSGTISVARSPLVETPAEQDWAIRAYREGDIPGLVVVANASNEADGVEHHTSEEELASSFAMPFSDPPTQVIVAEGQDGRFAGYGRILSIDDEAGSERIYQFTIRVDPDARGKGLDEALAGRLMAMARAHNQEPDRAPIGKVSVLSMTRVENTRMKALFETMGLRDLRHAWVMERPLGEPLSEPYAVDGVTLRAYRRPEDNIVAHEAYNNSFIDHFEYHALPLEFWNYQMDRPEVRPDLSWLAEADGEPGKIAGFCICEIKDSDNRLTGRKEGWIGLLGTVRGWRGKGLGRSLLLQGLRSLKDAGMETALLGVDSESLTGANRLYESVGFTVRHHEVMYKCELDEIAI